MKKITLSILMLFFSLMAFAKPTGTYKIVVEGFDWGAGVNKIILQISDTTSKVNSSEYQVFVTRKSTFGSISDDQNKRDIIGAYISDEQGNRLKTGKNITLVLAVGPQ